MDDMVSCVHVGVAGNSPEVIMHLGKSMGKEDPKRSPRAFPAVKPHCSLLGLPLPVALWSLTKEVVHFFAYNMASFIFSEQYVIHIS